VLRMLRDVAGIGQVLFGTDFPYLPRALAVKARQRILESPELSPSEKEAILEGNATRLFPRLDKRGEKR
jgi:6-methylsalicylate decarboxylase